MAGKRIIDLPACMSLGLTDLMEISQYSTSQISGKVTLAALQAFLSNPTLAQVLYYGNVSGGNHIDMTSGDLIRALGNSYNNLTLETSFNQLSAQDPTSNEQVFYQCISGAGGSYTQIKSSDLATGAYSNIQLSQENGLVISTSILGGYSTQLSWSPTAWNIYSTYSTFKGLEYGLDYSANYSSRSLIDKGYASATFLSISTAASTYLALSGGTMVGNINGVTPTEITYLSGVTSNVQNQINNILSGLSWKLPVRVSIFSNVTIASPGSTIDGVTMAVSDRVLLAGQSTGSQNGLYVWNGAAVPMTRSADATTGGTGSTGILGATVVTEEGTYADQIYTCSTNAPITIGVTSLTFVKTSATTYTGSNGISLTGNNFTLDNSYFSGAFTLSAGVATIANSYVTNAMLAGSIDSSKLAAMTSAQLAGIISDETGYSAGALAVFSISPALTGNPTATTQSQADNSTKIATTSYVDTALDTANQEQDLAVQCYMIYLTNR